jgi:hypothetical protein
VHLCHDLPGFCPGLDNLVHSAEEKLESKKVLAIVGMGGIGKTTIAKRLFNKISCEYEYTCFMDNVKGIFNLRKEVLGEFHHNGIKVKPNEMEWSRLMGKKMLLVMDDVDSGEELNCLPQSLSVFANGSRLIITSRNQHVVKDPKIRDDSIIFDVNLLGDDDARNLFCHHAFGSEEKPPGHLLESVKKIVQKCQGLPLTLEVLGCYLRGQNRKSDLDLWKDAIKCLKDADAVEGGDDDKVWARLRISYDKRLSREEKGMFIDAATFFFEQKSEEALAAWSTAYGKSKIRWKNLLSTSMVKEREEREGPSKVKYIWVHEHLRDLANKISKGDVPSVCYGVDETSYKVRAP